MATHILFIIPFRESKYTQRLILPGVRVTVSTDNFISLSHITLYCRHEKITHIATTVFSVYKLFDSAVEGTQNNNAGAVYLGTPPVLLLPSLVTIYSVNHGEFLIKRFIRKLLSPATFLQAPPLVYEEYFPTMLAEISKEPLLAIDIETDSTYRAIKSIAYAGLKKTWTIDLRRDPIGLNYIRQINALPMPKIFHNGIYDNLYLLRFNCPVHNYIFDTEYLMHCMYSELPKTLAFVSAFFLRNYRYWKEESATNLILYNAKDAHNTLWTFLAMLQENVPWANANYLIEFPLVFPCITCSLEGLAVDTTKREELKAAEIIKRNDTLASLVTMLRLPGFNPGSPKQSLELLHALGDTKAESSDSKTILAFCEKAPLFDRIGQQILAYRKAVKAIGNYYESELWDERFFYTIHPDGTETGRLASSSSSFWCGGNIQNQPAYCKSQYMADQGWELAEIDNSQSESRATAYISGDENLIDSVEYSPDFHCKNASLFFGIPFEELFDAEHSKVLRKDIRTLAKRVNHGANYNMGAEVLLTTMGTKNVFAAAKLLRLPESLHPIDICKYLLLCFDKAYPKIKSDYYQATVKQIELTGLLVGATGWTRKTFLKPRKSKLDLNAAVAHAPQSLSVMIVNKAFYKIWRYQMQTESKLFRLKAQIHDSIFYQFRPDAAPKIHETISTLMKIPTKVNGRTLLIPNDLSVYGTHWDKT